MKFLTPKRLVGLHESTNWIFSENGLSEAEDDFFIGNSIDEKHLLSDAFMYQFHKFHKARKILENYLNVFKNEIENKGH